MSGQLQAPFFEIGPKNLLRRDAIERIAVAAGRAGAELDVTVVMTVPTALVAPVHELGTGVAVYAQGVDLEPPGTSMFRVTAESLVDAGATGVMLNHDSNPLDPDRLASAVARCGELGLGTILCAPNTAQAARFAAYGPAAVLYEPSELIGTVGTGTRDWIGAATAAIHAAGEGVLAMHAGGVATPQIAETIMTAGADGTGSTSGVLGGTDPAGAAALFIAATRRGWDRAARPGP